MNHHNRKRFILLKPTVILVVIFMFIGYLWFVKNHKTSPKESTDDINTQIEKEQSIVYGCSRESRLDNKAPFDRALSLIEEKYQLWESTNTKFNYFSSNLVNCIKINVGNVKRSTGAEGFFEIGNKEIKQNYYPITVDTDYNYNDDILNALLLVHEITHVRQFIDKMNDKQSLSCIDQETEAFYAQFQFYSYQFPEVRKSMDLRIKNDKDLHPQLAMIVNLRDNMDLDGVRKQCLYGDGKDNENCIDNYRKNEIKQMLLNDNFYRKECNL